jgi:tetratricopeptide (TPR) repeat protein
MAKPKKVSRKALLNEPDEFLTVSARLLQLALQYKYHLIGALGAVIALVLVVSGIAYISQKRAGEAFTRLQSLWAKYETVKGESDPVKAYQTVEADFEQLIADYGDKTGGRMARVLLANICDQAGNTDKAIALFTAAAADFEDPLLKNLVLSGLGYAYEKKQDFTAAADYFQKVADSADTILRADSLYQLGQVYAALGQTDKSRQAYQEVLATQPDFMYSAMIKEMARQ